jgi:predicted O-methyltransferase YrrM
VNTWEDYNLASDHPSLHDRLSLSTGIFARWLSSLFDARSKQLDTYLLHRRLRAAGLSNVRAIPTWTTEGELRALFDLGASRPQNAVALEIGSYLGASACFLAAGLAQVNGHLYCVDTWQNETMLEGERDTFSEFLNNTRGIEKWITPVRKRSSDLSESDVKVPLDLIFLDGDHSYESIKEDFERSESWIAKDGVIAFHDCNAVDHKGVSRVIGEALASGRWMIEGHVDCLLWVRQVQ